MNEFDLTAKIKENCEKISQFYKDSQSQTMRISLSALQEQAYRDYYQHIERNVLPLLAQLYKLNPDSAIQCVTSYILAQYHQQIIDGLKSPTPGNLNDAIINDIKRSAQDFYKLYKKAIDDFKIKVQADPNSLNIIENFDLDFTTLDKPGSSQVTELDTEEIYKQKAIKIKMDRFILPFLEANKTKLIMLAKNDFIKFISLLINLQNRDLQLTACSKEYNPALFAVIRNTIKEIITEQKKTKKPLFTTLMLKFFFLKYDPTDPSQEKKLPVKVLGDAILELNLKSEVEEIFSV